MAKRLHHPAPAPENAPAESSAAPTPADLCALMDSLVPILDRLIDSEPLITRLDQVLIRAKASVVNEELRLVNDALVNQAKALREDLAVAQRENRRLTAENGMLRAENRRLVARWDDEDGE